MLFRSGPEISSKFRNYNGLDVCAKRNYKNQFPEDLVNDFVAWLRSLNANGYLGAPLDWSRTP